ncbi:hypothetical protein [Streptomyces sp. NPDC050848]|uniref:hypothetical protein n=1 Tax=Streptomyces sp. NPDC050848 TaxID=3155791 RepID=UPI0033E9FAC2
MDEEREEGECGAEHPHLAEAVADRDLLSHLRDAGEAEAAGRARVPASEPTAPPVEPRRRRPYGLETDGTPASPWTWNDLNHPGTDPGTHPRALVRTQSRSPRRHHPSTVADADTDTDTWNGWERYFDN